MDYLPSLEPSMALYHRPSLGSTQRLLTESESTAKPMRRLYILYDPRCGLCSWARCWLARQPAYFELTFVPAGSEQAVRLFPGLTRLGEVEELVVISDDGAVYRDSRAWIMSLYALEDYRELALRLAHPLLLPLRGRRSPCSRKSGGGSRAAGPGQRSRDRRDATATRYTCLCDRGNARAIAP